MYICTHNIIHKIYVYPHIFLIATDADIELDTLRKENQQLRGENQELRDQLALVHPPGGIMEIQTTSARLTSKLLLRRACTCHMCAASPIVLGGCEQ